MKNDKLKQRIIPDDMTPEQAAHYFLKNYEKTAALKLGINREILYMDKEQLSRMPDAEKSAMLPQLEKIAILVEKIEKMGVSEFCARICTNEGLSDIVKGVIKTYNAKIPRDSGELKNPLGEFNDSSAPKRFDGRTPSFSL